MEIQWYPGHMQKTKRLMRENLTFVDVVVELLDARVPYSSKNPDIDALVQNKHRIVALNKSDLADPDVTAMWINFYREKGVYAIGIDSLSGKGLGLIADKSKELLVEKRKRQKERGRVFAPVRAMIAGIPNVGKSTLINSYAGKSIAKTGDRPGVTKSQQWIKVRSDFELMDTPGILWHKFDDKEVGVNLALTGAIKDENLDIYTLSLKLIERVMKLKPTALDERYKISVPDGAPPDEILEIIGSARGFMKKGGIIDAERAAIILLDEFRGSKLGRISLETPCLQNN